MIEIKSIQNPGHVRMIVHCEENGSQARSKIMSLVLKYSRMNVRFV